MKKTLKEYEQEIRIIIVDEFKEHILFVGNEILDDKISAKDFWEKLKLFCL